MLFLTTSTLASCAAPNAAPATTTGASASASPTGTPTTASETSSPAVTPTPTPSGPEHCGPGSAIAYEPAAFQASPKIDNKWHPLTPGMQYTTTGTVTNAEGTTERTVIHSVTGLTKVINGVKTQVL